MPVLMRIEMLLLLLLMMITFFEHLLLDVYCGMFNTFIISHKPYDNLVTLDLFLASFEKRGM